MTDAGKIRKQANGRQTKKVEMPSLWVIKQKWLKDCVYLWYYSCYNEHLYSIRKSLVYQTICFAPVIVKYMKKTLVIANKFCQSLDPSGWIKTLVTYAVQVQTSIIQLKINPFYNFYHFYFFLGFPLDFPALVTS